MRVLGCEDRGSATAKPSPDVSHINKNGSKDIGYGELNEPTWGQYFKKRDLDIHIPDQNLEATVMLVSMDGLNDYQASKFCWN